MTKKELKHFLLEELYAPYKNCLQCPLSLLGRTHVVFGRGNPDAKLLLIGEAPGKDEDLPVLQLLILAIFTCAKI